MHSCSARLNWSWIVLSGLLAVAGCTKSHDLPGTGLLELEADASVDEIDAGDGDAGRGGAGGRAGASANAGRGGSAAAGRGGRGGSAAAGRSGGAAGSSTTNCNSCPVPGGLGGLIGAMSCCTTSNVCGLSAAGLGITECLPLDAPGAEDASCPGVAIAGLIQLPGCCAPDGTCGALDSLVGLGCAKIATGTNGETVSCTP
jgi:hypothetical protein